MTLHPRHWFLASVCVLGCNVTSVVPYTQQPSTAQPVFGGATVQAATAPPPVAGGTVRVGISEGAAYAIASDPDEDAIHVVSLGATPSLVGTIALLPGDEPNRIAFDAQGLAHVVLRGSGAIATIDPKTASLVARSAVCPAPRGITYDASTDSLYVACATGELVTLQSGGAVTRTVRLDRDLRDVVLDHNGQLFVTRFRAAERLAIDAAGAVSARSTPAPAPTYYASMSPVVAWRTVVAPGGGTVMLHQLASNDALVVAPQQTYYAQTTSFISASAVTVSGQAPTVLSVEQAIDVTVDDQGKFEALSLTGTIQIGPGSSYSSDNIVTLAPTTYGHDNTYQFIGLDDGSPIGVPFKVVQERAPSAALLVYAASFSSAPTVIVLPQKASHLDIGFDVFHIPTVVGSACMTCHPEGGDDGHTWKFTFTSGDVEARRTQSLRGGVVTSTAPYHWDGDLGSLQSLCDEVFTHRMGGGLVVPKQATVLAHWLNAIPRIPVRADLDPQRVAQGKAIFEGSAGCASCHVGGVGTLTTNQDIGKTDILGDERPLQVPSLLDVADRAPFMHDGCAKTLMDRFTNASCGGASHGNTASLGPDDLSSLTTYLESL